MRKHIYGYTMVEILMVIVIAAILFGIGIPAFSTMIRGNAMTVSIRQLTAKIQAARSYAVTNRCKVALILCGTELSSSSLKPAFCYSAYRVCVVTGDSPPFTFESWIDGEEWKRLPTGVLTQVVVGGVQVNGCTISDLGGTTMSFTRCLIFKSDGQITAAAKLGLTYGRYISGTIINTEVESGSVLYHPITINQYTGKTTVGDTTPTAPTI